MAKRAERCRLLYLAKRTSSGGLITYAKSVAVVGLEDISLTNNYAEGSAFSDNVQDINIKKPSYRKEVSNTTTTDSISFDSVKIVMKIIS
ncbi:hypothetical protein [Clostridium sp. CMCC3677]|uniref:hypothetical protein n=1 Tax=Clostridium sp. CMCC3677 TaxID=2949963 RepID=UPI0013F01B9F|nr:hypothetical protein [Clostridium sp. CMCC3677]NFG63147.1 hypothetical protein [Clostridium botulinum]NFQ10968.1 hypothetical protein [Clostridium botulinum]